MNNTYEPNYKQIDEIYIREIIFEKDKNSTDVTIFGYYENPFEVELQEVDYVCDFSILTDLLIFANENGEYIIKAITEKLDDDDTEIPSRIDVENIFGKPLKIDNIILTIYKPFEQDDLGNWKEVNEGRDEFYIIDRVELKENLEEKGFEISNCQDDFADHMILLNNAYKYYIQLLEFKISKKEARKRSGLKDELLFRIALLNYQILKQQ
jgi:hypothetical protein